MSLPPEWTNDGIDDGGGAMLGCVFVLFALASIAGIIAWLIFR